MNLLWHLALECSSTGGSVALLKIHPLASQPELHAQAILPSDRGSVCTLAPAIERLLSEAGLTVGELESLSATAGPGSFTGLRVGLATAKMLALACHKLIVPVDTLETLAQRFVREQAPQLGRPVRLVTALNAFRGQVFTASWFIDASGIANRRPACVVDSARWLADPWAAGPTTGQLPERLSHPEDESAELWLTGPGLAVYAPPASSMSLSVAPQRLWQPLAEDVGQLGWRGYRLGQGLSAADLAPRYIRPSAAEEKRRL